MARADRLRPGYQSRTDLSVPFLQSSLDTPSNFFQKLKTRFIYGTQNFSLLAGDTGMQIANRVGALLGKDVPPNPDRFSNNEIRILVPPSVATKDVYVIQSTDGNPDTSLTQLKLLEEGAKGVGANRITAILTHLPYSRQDRREQEGAPEAARLFGKEIIRSGSHDPQKKRHESRLTADASLIVVDVHSEKPLQALTENNHYQWANLDSAHVLLPHIQALIESQGLDPVIAFPDKGAAARYQNYADMFGGIEHAAVIRKERDMTKNNTVKISDSQEDLTEKVSGKCAILIDDIIDSGGTTLQAARLLKEQGATQVIVVATHGIFSGKAMERMADDAIDKIIVTDSITHRAEVVINPKIQIVSLAPLIAETIRRIENRESIADLVKSISKDFERSYKKWGKIHKYRRRTARESTVR